LITVAECDKIIVMDQGQAVECDHPFTMLTLDQNDNNITKKNSVFSELVLKTG
jgi:hypothetical protein